MRKIQTIIDEGALRNCLHRYLMSTFHCWNYPASYIPVSAYKASCWSIKPFMTFVSFQSIPINMRKHHRLSASRIEHAWPCALTISLHPPRPPPIPLPVQNDKGRGQKIDAGDAQARRTCAGSSTVDFFCDDDHTFRRKKVSRYTYLLRTCAAPAIWLLAEMVPRRKRFFRFHRSPHIHVPGQSR